MVFIDPLSLRDAANNWIGPTRHQRFTVFDLSAAVLRHHNASVSLFTDVSSKKRLR